MFILEYEKGLWWKGVLRGDAGKMDIEEASKQNDKFQM